MGSRLLYMLPALAVALVALILALVGLSRDPTPALVVKDKGTDNVVHSGGAELSLLGGDTEPECRGYT